MTMSVNLLVVMDDISQIKVKKDSSIAMLWAAARRGWTLWYAEQDDLYVRDGAAFQWANDAHTVAFLAHVVTRCGSYLAEVAGVREGDSLAYLVAPPLEAAVGLDAALKEAEVRLAAYVRPPSPTNYSGAYLQGSQAACRAACDAFARTVADIAAQPLVY